MYLPWYLEKHLNRCPAQSLKVLAMIVLKLFIFFLVYDVTKLFSFSFKQVKNCFLIKIDGNLQASSGSR